MAKKIGDFLLLCDPGIVEGDTGDIDHDLGDVVFQIPKGKTTLISLRHQSHWVQVGR